MGSKVEHINNILDDLELDRAQISKIIAHLTAYNEKIKGDPPVEYRYQCLVCNNTLFVSDLWIETYYRAKVRCGFCGTAFEKYDLKNKNR